LRVSERAHKNPIRNEEHAWDRHATPAWQQRGQGGDDNENSYGSKIGDGIEKNTSAANRGSVKQSKTRSGLNLAHEKSGGYARLIPLFFVS
jgi:hypothetical protein